MLPNRNIFRGESVSTCASETQINSKKRKTEVWTRKRKPFATEISIESNMKHHSSAHTSANNRFQVKRDKTMDRKGGSQAVVQGRAVLSDGSKRPLECGNSIRYIVNASANRVRLSMAMSRNDNYDCCDRLHAAHSYRLTYNGQPGYSGKVWPSKSSSSDSTLNALHSLHWQSAV